MLKNDFDCADAVQEAIFKAFVKLDSLREEKYFKTWLCRILIRECYKIAGALKRQQPALDDYTEPYYYNEEIGLYDAIMQLNPKHRLAVTLHYIEGFSVAEIAKILKIPQGTVKSRLSKARAMLKFELSLDTQCIQEKEKNHEKNEEYIPIGSVSDSTEQLPQQNS